MTPEEIRLTRQLAQELLIAPTSDPSPILELAQDLARRTSRMAEDYLKLYTSTYTQAFPRTLRMDEVFVVIDQILAIEIDFSKEPISDICGCIRLNQDVDYYIPLKYRSAFQTLLAEGLDLQTLSCTASEENVSQSQ